VTVLSVTNALKELLVDSRKDVLSVSSPPLSEVLVLLVLPVTTVSRWKPELALTTLPTPPTLPSLPLSLLFLAQ
jgi:hypothetical protein